MLSNRVGTVPRVVPSLFCGLVVVAVAYFAETFGTARQAISPLEQTLPPRRESPPLPLPLPALSANEPPADAPESMPDSTDRVADARSRRGAHLTTLFRAAGLDYPAREVYLRVFKREARLELWARSHSAPAPFRLVQTYPVLCASGGLGPKRQEGDGQVPEGFYTVDRFNPRSLFHVSLGLNYPNAADRLLTTDPEHPGTDIFIHGNALSVGCLAMGDAVAEELYLAAADARARTGSVPAVHIFPCRMNEESWQTVLAPLCAGRPSLEKLWRSLRAGYDRFERTRQVPAVRVDEGGDYQMD